MIMSLPSKLCRKLSCLPPIKIVAVTSSSSLAQAKLKEKRGIPELREPPCITIGKNFKPPAFVINPRNMIPPDIKYENVVEKKPNESKTIKIWKLGNIEVDPTKLHKYCLMLSKIRLTSLVVITAMGGYALAPGPFELTTFLACSVGTGLVSAAANAVNQSMEIPFDAKMARTQNRVLVRGLLAPQHALWFAVISGAAGVTLLALEVNSLSAILAGANLVLYTSIYTPLKRVSIVNTWVGSIVGAIPPLMGWAGCVGTIISPGAWIMSGMLYAWQFPHFNALSWNLKPDYSKAGYRMMAVSNPDLCRRTSFRYTVVLTALSYLAPVVDVTNWWFALASTPLNAYFLYLAWEFRKHGDARTSRKLFRFSLVHLPILMTMMLLCKKYWFINVDKKDKSHVTELKEKNKLIEAITSVIQPTSA